MRGYGTHGTKVTSMLFSIALIAIDIAIVTDNLSAACYCCDQLYFFVISIRFADPPNYGSIFACFWNIGDFYSDISFLFVLYFEIDKYPYLFYGSLACTVIPYLASNIVHYIFFMKQDNIIFTWQTMLIIMIGCSFLYPHFLVFLLQ